MNWENLDSGLDRKYKFRFLTWLECSVTKKKCRYKCPMTFSHNESYKKGQLFTCNKAYCKNKLAYSTIWQQTW